MTQPRPSPGQPLPPDTFPGHADDGSPGFRRVDTSEHRVQVVSLFYAALVCPCQNGLLRTDRAFRHVLHGTGSLAAWFRPPAGGCSG